MGKKILIIGGTRFFGKALVDRLINSSNDVTIATRGLATDSFGNAIKRIIVDRRDEKAMIKTFSSDELYDIIYDQICYNPIDAAISLKVFEGKVKRYIMASTIEVYHHLQGKIIRPFLEEDLDFLNESIDLMLPWHHHDFAIENYGKGKRQAEALLLNNATFPIVTVRIGHVLSGRDDFTERLLSYVKDVFTNNEIKCFENSKKSSFLNVYSISDFMCWLGNQEFTGPINASSEGSLSALDLYQRVSHILNKPIRPIVVSYSTKLTQFSPFDYAYPYVIDTKKANLLGYRFTHTNEWLDDLIKQHYLSLC